MLEITKLPSLSEGKSDISRSTIANHLYSARTLPEVEASIKASGADASSPIFKMENTRVDYVPQLDGFMLHCEHAVVTDDWPRVIIRNYILVEEYMSYTSSIMPIKFSLVGNTFALDYLNNCVCYTQPMGHKITKTTFGNTLGGYRTLAKILEYDNDIGRDLLIGIIRSYPGASVSLYEFAKALETTQLAKLCEIYTMMQGMDKGSYKTRHYGGVTIELLGTGFSVAISEVLPARIIKDNVLKLSSNYYKTFSIELEGKLHTYFWIIYEPRFY